eukprot:symbB.v1.2.034431.t3/scaffold4443.1/size39582/1
MHCLWRRGLVAKSHFELHLLQAVIWPKLPLKAQLRSRFLSQVPAKGLVVLGELTPSSIEEDKDSSFRLPRSYAMQEETPAIHARSRKTKDHKDHGRVQVVVEEEEEIISPTRRAMKPSVARALTEFVNQDLTPRQGTSDSLASHLVLDMQYFSNVDVSVDTGNGLYFGMRHLKCNGKICISLQPLMQQFPIAGAVQIFFPFVPEVDIEFTGLAALGHFPGIEQTIRDSVKDWLRSHFVLPRIKALSRDKARLCGCFAKSWQAMTFSSEVDTIKAVARRPIGVLHAKVLRANNLAGVNCHAFEQGSFTSHPYCILSLGDSSARTSTVRDTTFPKWPEDEEGGYLVVHHREQHLQVEVQAEASGSLFSHNFTGFLGSIACRVGQLRRWPVQDESGKRTSTLTLDTLRVNRELLHVDDPVSRGVPSTLDLEVQWYDIVEEPTLTRSEAW